jgi:hypothetical protein
MLLRNANYFTMMMAAIHSSETLVLTRSTRSHITENVILYIRRSFVVKRLKGRACSTNERKRNHTGDLSESEKEREH